MDWGVHTHTSLGCSTGDLSQKNRKIGLGAMGAPMASHLLRTFGSVNVYNRTHAKTLWWCEQNIGSQAFDNLAELAKASDAVFLCIGNDDDVRHTIQTMLPHLKPASVIVDHTITSRALAQEMATLCANHQVSFLDCPVSGGQAGAQNGVLTIMAGGDEATFERIHPFLQAFSKHQQYFGVSGNGQSVIKCVHKCLACDGELGQAIGSQAVSDEDDEIAVVTGFECI
ncbi:NAD(P)-dependent oxidoreductase [Formosimonas limnophila]|uniref:NAD(P)-dependent oxidoreductase n=1 Tax=Formosimonas limnophila TaxID=1384487 RepID=UPI0027E5BC57|nr:NAD(P)-binding domain-containing protein [Formosimonas limnophila]